MNDRIIRSERGPRTRRDVVSGRAMPENELIRFVQGPEGGVVPDLGRKLPGRGVWVAADRGSIETAQRKQLFARSARRAVRASESLADEVEGLLFTRVLSGLGLLRKAGYVAIGFETAREAVSGGRAIALIEAIDGSPDGRRKVLARIADAPNPVRVLGLFDCGQISLALGGENVIHAAVLSGRGAGRWLAEVERLAGFCPLYPVDWGLSNASQSRTAI